MGFKVGEGIKIGRIRELKIREVKNELGCGNRSVMAKIVEPCISHNVFYAPSLCGIKYPFM